MGDDMQAPSAHSANSHRQRRRPHRVLAVWLAALAVIFSPHLFHWFRFAQRNDLYSYILLIPPLCVYLLWLHRHPSGSGTGWARRPAFVLFGAALLWLAVSAAIHGEAPLQDRMAYRTLGLVLLVWAGCLATLDRAVLQRQWFSLAFLVFAAPLPVFLENAFNRFLQVGSAHASAWLIGMTGTPIYMEGMLLQLPGVLLEVAEECSGIRSSLVLLLVGLLGAHLFLRSAWRKTALVLFVFPLGIIRNAVRITILGVWAIRDPEILKSALHRQGGPLFFVFSLIPLLVLLLILARTEPSQETRS